MSKPNPTVEEIASAFFFNYHKVVHNRFIRLDGSEYAKAKKDPKKWLAFEQVTKVINDNDLDYQDYMEFTFKHFKKYIHPKTLMNIGNLRRYYDLLETRHNKKTSEKIYNNIMKSIRHVVLVCKTHDLENVTEFFGYCIQNDLLGTYLMTGKLSKYFLAMFGNIENLASMCSHDSYEELRIGVLKHREQLNQESRKSILEMIGKNRVSIVAITNHNIEKTIGTTKH